MAIPTAQRPARGRLGAFRPIIALILREMASTYGRSPGGYLWAILEPVGGVALLSIVFSLALRSPSLGTNFAYFYATGLIPFTIYQSVSNQTATAIRYSQALLAYPAVTFMDALLARFLLNILTQLLVFCIVIFGIVQVYDLNPILDWGAIFTAIAMIVALSFAVGTMNCFLFSIMPMWERVWAILNRPMFIVSGIFFIPENVPERMRDAFMLNPVAHLVSGMRKGFYANYEGKYVDPLYVFMIATVLSILSLLFLLRYHKDIVIK